MRRERTVRTEPRSGITHLGYEDRVRMRTVKSFDYAAKNCDALLATQHVHARVDV
jgi:hypothetical protein